MSATSSCSSRWNRFDSASRLPFSAIRQCPPKTTSVVDSSTPHEAVDVTGDAAARLAGDELPAVRRLADDLVAGREVEQHRGPGERLATAGGTGTHRSSQISTPTVTPGASGTRRAWSVPKGTWLPSSEIVFERARDRRAEPAVLVELLVVRQVRLRDRRQHLAAVQDRGAVEQLLVVPQRQADHGQAGEASGRGAGHALQRGQGAVAQHRLVEQVGAGVAGQAQLGKDEHAHALLFGPLHQADDLLGVELAIGHAQARHRRGDPQEPVMEHDRLDVGHGGDCWQYIRSVAPHARTPAVRPGDETSSRWLIHPRPNGRGSPRTTISYRPQRADDLRPRRLHRRHQARDDADQE